MGENTDKAKNTLVVVAVVGVIGLLLFVGHRNSQGQAERHEAEIAAEDLIYETDELLYEVKTATTSATDYMIHPEDLGSYERYNIEALCNSRSVTFLNIASDDLGGLNKRIEAWGRRYMAINPDHLKESTKQSLEGDWQKLQSIQNQDIEPDFRRGSELEWGQISIATTQDRVVWWIFEVCPML